MSDAKYAFLCRAYLDGDTEAVEIIDTLVSCGADLAFLRSKASSVDYGSLGMDYHEIRQDLDEATDRLERYFYTQGITHSLPVLESAE
jgi:hypothetical protein